MENLERKSEMDELLPWEEALFDYLRRFLKTQNEKKRMDIITQMADHKIISPYSHQEADLFIMFGSSLQYNSFGILLRMPYLHLLDELKHRQDNGTIDIFMLQYPHDILNPKNPP